jgi:hypothetical protein
MQHTGLYTHFPSELEAHNPHTQRPRPHCPHQSPFALNGQKACDPYAIQEGVDASEEDWDTIDLLIAAANLTEENEGSGSSFGSDARFRYSPSYIPSLPPKKAQLSDEKLMKRRENARRHYETNKGKLVFQY